MSSLSTLLLLWSCATTPAARPTIVALASPEPAVLRLQEPEAPWPDLDVPPWEPTVTPVVDEARETVSTEALALELESLASHLTAARCPATLEAPELADAELALMQGRQVLIRQNPRVMAEMLTWVQWIDATLETHITRCGA